MRGILYRTDEEGNVLDKPEIKISALKSSNIKVYENQEAKQAALANGDIKPGDVVLSGGDEAENRFTYTCYNLSIIGAPFTAPAAGIASLTYYKNTGQSTTFSIKLNGVALATLSPPNTMSGTGLAMNKGDVLSVEGLQYCLLSFAALN